MARPGPVLILCILLGTLSLSYGSISLVAQCRAQCFTDFHIPYGNLTKSSLCLEANNCSSCIIPCSSPYYKSKEHCRSQCQTAFNETICHNTCDYLKFNSKSKKGECPRLEDISGFAKACALTCSDDSQCGHKLKCCSNGCGRTCQEPVINKKLYPSKIRNPASVTENPDGRSITIEWTMRKMVSENETVLYVIQGRNSTGQHPNRHMSDWIDMDIVEDMYYMTALGLGRYYSFRIAAVNENGSLGFGQPTPPFRLSTALSAPSAPLNLREGKAVVVGDNINIAIVWDPPKNADTELLRYRIFYSERRASVSPFLYGIEEHRHNVPKNQHYYDLTNLHQGMRYFIQVQAMVQSGDKILRSERASLYIDTMEVHPRDSPPGPSPWDVPFDPQNELFPSPPRDVEPEDPYWEDSVLKAKIRWRKPKGQEDGVNRFTIHWRPDSCLQDQQNSILEASTHDTFFDIYDLRFDCQYMVSVVAVSDSTHTSPAATIHFYTPPCTEVIVLGSERPICPTPVPDLPSLPQNVSYYFILSELNITAQFRWKAPSSSLHPITGYNIIWAEPRPEPPDVHVFGQGFPIIDMETRHSKRLKHNELSYSLSPLKSGTQYVVQLWAYSSIGGGAMYTQVITTPKIKSNPVMPDLNSQSWTLPPRPEDNRVVSKTETLSPAPNRTGKKGQHVENGGNCACSNHLPMLSLLSVSLVAITVILFCR
ncbi:anosmin-1-like isoform X2 [Amphiura filiformis]|uniref:anosmin-1-like isoform X2 n=1 Tax=Amphiura filiformis TaxID=82378 RepID=UPI003B21F093